MLNYVVYCHFLINCYWNASISIILFFSCPWPRYIISLYYRLFAKLHWTYHYIDMLVSSHYRSEIAVIKYWSWSLLNFKKTTNKLNSPSHFQTPWDSYKQSNEVLNHRLDLLKSSKLKFFDLVNKKCLLWSNFLNFKTEIFPHNAFDHIRTHATHFQKS